MEKIGIWESHSNLLIIFIMSHPVDGRTNVCLLLWTCGGYVIDDLTHTENPYNHLKSNFKKHTKS